MPIKTIADVEDALSQNFAPQIARQWNRSVTLATIIPVKPAGGNGKNTGWDTEFTGSVDAEAVDEGSDVEDAEFDTDDNEPAIIPWATYRSSFSLSEQSVDAAIISGGTATALMNLMEERVMGATTKITSRINRDMFTGTGVNGGGKPNLVGFYGGALEASGLYAGISRATYGEWAGNVLANGAVLRPLTTDLLAQLDANIFDRSGQGTPVIVSSTGVHRKYEGMFEGIRRITNATRYDRGSEDLFWRGKPVLRDKDAPAGSALFVDPNNCEMKFLPHRRVQETVMAQMRAAAGSDGDKEMTVPNLPLRIAFLGKTGDSYKVSVRCTVALCVKRPNSMGYISDIDES